MAYPRPVARAASPKPLCRAGGQKGLRNKRIFRPAWHAICRLSHGGITVAEPTAQLLREAHALRTAFPDLEAMQSVTISDLPEVAARFLRDEMLLVRAGKSGTLNVLEDEMAALIKCCG
jgi:hypothetical protein